MIARLWYVVDRIDGHRYEPGHLTYAEALTACADKTAEFDGDSAGRFDVECQHETPWAHAIPTQTAPRTGRN